MLTAHGRPQEVLGRLRKERYTERVAALIERLPKPPDEYVVFTAPPGMTLIEVIEATADLDTVREFDRYVKMPRGYASVHFLRQLFAVTG